jgi:hypothetical protein
MNLLNRFINKFIQPPGHPNKFIHRSTSWEIHSTFSLPGALGIQISPAREARRGNFGVFGAQKHRNMKYKGNPAREARREFFWGIWSPKSTKS